MFTKVLYTQITIEASAERVWQILIDFGHFPEWNPFIPRADGEIKVGARLEVLLQPPDSAAMTFRPTVLAAEPGRELRWLGRLIFPGLFDGEHCFQIEPLGEGRVRFIQQEHFRGLFVPLLARSLDDNTRRGFEAMNQALKARAEQAGA